MQKLALNEVCKYNIVTIVWIPSHVGFVGNEVADRLAKLGTRNPQNQPKVDTGRTKAFFRNAIRKWGCKKHTERWQNSLDCRQTKMFLPNIDGKCWRIIRNFNRKNIMYATQIITGHNFLNRHLALMNVENDSMCNRCNLEPETIEHVVKSCPAYARIRREKLGEYYLTESISRYSLKKVLAFVSASNRLHFDYG